MQAEEYGAELYANKLTSAPYMLIIISYKCTRQLSLNQSFLFANSCNIFAPDFLKSATTKQKINSDKSL